MGEFPAWFPEGCPQGASEVTAILFHGCETNPSTEEDFTPHARSQVPRKKERARRAGCMAYGLSMWTSEEDAHHAQELFRYAARWHIFRGEVTPNDGRLAPTPARNQSAHHTFWSYDGVNLMVKFALAFPPIAGRA